VAAVVSSAAAACGQASAGARRFLGDGGVRSGGGVVARVRAQERMQRKKMKWERQRPSLPFYSLRGGRGSRILRAHDRCNRSEKIGNGRPRSSHIVGHDPLDQNCRWAFKAHRSRGGTAVSKALEGLPDGTRRQNAVQASEVCEFQGRFVSQVGDTWPACVWSQFKCQCRSAN